MPCWLSALDSLCSPSPRSKLYSGELEEGDPNLNPPPTSSSSIDSQKLDQEMILRKWELRKDWSDEREFKKSEVKLERLARYLCTEERPTCSRNCVSTSYREEESECNGERIDVKD